jgi:hypothetical protein
VTDTLSQVARDRARYGIDGGYIGIPYLALVEASLLAADGWAGRRDRQVVVVLAKTGAVAMLGVVAGRWYRMGPGKLAAWRPGAGSPVKP